MVMVVLWTLVVVAAGFFVACLLDDLLDPQERAEEHPSGELSQGAPAH